MPDTVVEPAFGEWTAPNHSVRIEYSDAVMQQIRMEAVDGYHRVPHGGVETGGVLFGTHQDGVVRIHAWRPINCEYARGPSFSLSEKDRAALSEMLRSYRGELDLTGLEPVGWYHSHTRSEIFLSEQDLEFYQRYFPEPWQVALVVRPAAFAPPRGGFFFREADGSVHAQGSYTEFLLALARTSTPPQVPRHRERAPEPEQEPEQVPVAAHPPVETALVLAERISAPELRRPMFEPRREAHWKWYAVIACLITIAAVSAAMVAFWLLQSPIQHLSLSATDRDGQLRIAWDGSTPAVRDAARGTLEINDHGVRTEARLTPLELRSGSISYARQSGDVTVRLKVEQPGHNPVEEVTRFLKPGEPAPAAPAAAAASAPPPAPVPQAAAATPAPVPQVDPAKAAKEREAAAMRARIAEQDGQLNVLRKIVGTMHEQNPNVPLPPPPDQQATAQTTVPAAIANVPASEPTRPPPPATTAASAPTAASARPVATSGRMIWTGKLSKNDRLIIEGNRASAGAVVGSLPMAPAQVRVYPGDLTSVGMTLFTADTKYIHPLTEPAGAHNGWNRTTYTFDPRRSGGVRVIEQPGPKNGYRLVLEGDTAKLGVLVVEWRAAQ